MAELPKDGTSSTELGFFYFIGMEMDLQSTMPHFSPWFKKEKASHE